MGTLIRLADNGIDPSLATALDDMQDGIWATIVAAIGGTAGVNWTKLFGG